MKFKNLISNLCDVYESSKGIRILQPIEIINDPNHKYSFHLSDDTILNIHCEEERYKLSYDKWWARDKIISVYRVYAVSGNGVHPEISDKFKNKELIISNLWHSYANIENQKKAAINAFIDIILFHAKKTSLIKN
jgi:hypothetical protein